MELTNLEILVLNASQKTDFGDCAEKLVWNFAVQDASKLDSKIYRGVVSSLIKKGLVSIYDYENKGKYEDMIFQLTEEGKKILSD